MLQCADNQGELVVARHCRFRRRVSRSRLSAEGQQPAHPRGDATTEAARIDELQRASAEIITFRTNMLVGNTTDGSTPFSISLK